MAYEVTATRKRPKTFDELAGQDFVVATLKNSLQTGRMAHAYLFAGPRGVGKTSAARILAKSLNCIEGPKEIPCDKCANCMEIAKVNSLDVIEIDGASNTSVNDVREIKDEVLFLPNSSRHKIYIIDEVHMLSNSAFNALLKTIEEPPPYIVFIFATTEVHKVPATIRSRCQQFNFRLVSVDKIKELLVQIADEIKISAEDDALFWIAKEATGSIRDAFTLFDQIVSFSEKKITFDIIREKLGLVGMDRINEIVELLAETEARKALELVDDIIYRGVSIEQFVVDLAEYFRNVLFIKHGIRKESLLGYKVDRFSPKVLETFSDVQIEHAIELVLKLHRDIRYSLNQRYELELLISRLSILADFIHPRDILEKIQTLRNGFEGMDSSLQKTNVGDGTEDRTEKKNKIAPAVFSEDITAKSESGPEGSGAFSEEKKKELIGLMKKEHLSLASSLGKVLSWQQDGRALTLFCETQFHSDNIQRERKIIEQVLDTQFGLTLRIAAAVSPKTEKNENVETNTSTDERVETIRRIFRGEIVENGRQ
jgi:DNA polymerase III subunit gamma/tau